MKNFLAVAAALAFATPLVAQTSIGARAGMTLSSFSTSEEDESVEISRLAGLHLGVTASFGGEGTGILLSAAYTQRGTTLTEDVVFGDDSSGEPLEATLNLAYIEVGAFGRVPIGAGPYLLAGPTLGLRVACSSSFSAEGTTVSADCGEGGPDDPFKTFDFGVSGGAGVSFDMGGLGVVVEALYGFGILNLNDVGGDESIKNRGFTIRAGVDFGR